MTNIIEKLKNNNIFFDGAMGTILYAKGIRSGEIPDILNITNPDVVIDIHKEYIDAGCDVITTNTFNSSSYKLAGTGYTTYDVVSAALKNAKTAVEQMGRKEEVYIACDIGPIGKLLAPMGDVTFEQAYRAYKQIADAAVKNGADLFIIETMNDIYDAKAAVLACKENSDLPVFCTMTLEKNDRTLTGSDITIIGKTLGYLGVDAVGLNCSRGPDGMEHVIKTLADIVNIPVIIQPNAGMPYNENGQDIFPLGASDFAKAVNKLSVPGVRVFGGCCGTTPSHIRELINVTGRSALAVERKPVYDFVCSPAQLIEITEKIRISKDIIFDTLSDVDDIIDEIYVEIDNGCEVVSIALKEYGNDKLSEIEFSEMINEIQGIIKLPLVFKTSSDRLAAMVRRYYNGKPGIIME